MVTSAAIIFIMFIKLEPFREQGPFWNTLSICFSFSFFHFREGSLFPMRPNQTALFFCCCLFCFSYTEEKLLIIRRQKPQQTPALGGRPPVLTSRVENSCSSSTAKKYSGLKHLLCQYISISLSDYTKEKTAGKHCVTLYCRGVKLTSV